MNQPKVDSALESIVNILIGFCVALAAQLIWFPMIDKEFSMLENVLTTVFFTLVSFARSYTIRRLFNGKSIFKTLFNSNKR